MPPPVPAIGQPDQAEDTSAHADLQPYGMTVGRNPVKGKRQDHRYQAEDSGTRGDDGQAVDVSRRHRRLYQEMVVLDRLLHANHFSAAFRRALSPLPPVATVPEWANLVSYRGRMWW
jgi:hypothetical protein